MDALWRVVYRLGFRVMKLYWRLRRPQLRGAYVAVWHEGRVLCIRNSYRKNLSLPAGGLARREEPVDAAVRELAEEVAIEARPEDLHYVGEFVSHAGHAEDHAHFFELRPEGALAFRVDGREVVWADYLAPQDALDEGVVDVLRQYLEHVTKR